MKITSTMYRHELICTQEKLEAVQRRATAAKADAIDLYRAKYNETMGRYPHGLHYLSCPGNKETATVWLAPDDL